MEEKIVEEHTKLKQGMVKVLQCVAAISPAAAVVNPIFGVAGSLMRVVLHHIDDEDIRTLKREFGSVNRALDELSRENRQALVAIQKETLDSQYASVEENLKNQFRKFMDIIEAKPQFREVKTKLFLEHFSRSGGEKNLFVLYHALMGDSSFGESILDVVERYVSRNRRLLEDFCVRMKELFCLGLIALMGYTALTQNHQEEDDKIQDWSRKMDEIELRMKITIQSCVDAFAEQAKLDTQHFLQEKQIDSLQETSQQLLDFLVKKYDWVSWSVRLINHSGSTYRNWRAGERFHHVVGRNWFEVLQVNNINLVVSFSSRPQTVPRDAILEMMEGAARKGNAPTVVEVLEKQMSGFVVHAVSRHKESAAAWSFPDDCHYWERHKNVAVCVHAD
ncbi:protein rapunzel-like [Syngnathus typhle]|uniref:protein rapunzel-like n=1 Tax=Syngnathus typhle TaxID=161592 RepID=UPI002A6A6274|nr:protein rapunzel-like [Syngnathus typhle]